MLGLRLVALMASIATVAIAVPAAPDDTGCTVCADYVNDCGQWYGGCHNTCTQPQPVYDVPQCPCDDDPSDGIKRPAPCPEPKPGEICEWHYTQCGTRFGGCYPEAGPVPLWLEPECLKVDGGASPPAQHYGE